VVGESDLRTAEGLRLGLENNIKTLRQVNKRLPISSVEARIMAEEIRSVAQSAMLAIISTFGLNEAYNQQRDKQICFNRYLVRPLAIAELLALIGRHSLSMNKH